MKTTTVTVREAVAFARLTRQQIYNLIINGTVRATKLPGKRGDWMISLESLEQHLARRHHGKRPKE